MVPLHKEYPWPPIPKTTPCSKFLTTYPARLATYRQTPNSPSHRRSHRQPSRDRVRTRARSRKRAATPWASRPGYSMTTAHWSPENFARAEQALADLEVFWDHFETGTTHGRQTELPQLPRIRHGIVSATNSDSYALDILNRLDGVCHRLARERPPMDFDEERTFDSGVWGCLQHARVDARARTGEIVASGAAGTCQKSCSTSPIGAKSRTFRLILKARCPPPLAVCCRCRVSSAAGSRKSPPCRFGVFQFSWTSGSAPWSSCSARQHGQHIAC